MNRIDRLTAILIKLQSKRTTSAQEISEHFDISLRTVYRDIKALGEAGVPLGLDQGNGYFIVDGYHLPPVMLTKEEAGSIVLAGKLIDKMGDKSVSEEFGKALMKINSVLKGDQRNFVEDLDKYISVVKPKRPADDQFPDHFLADIKKALVEKTVLEFHYYSRYRDDNSTRKVEPLGLIFYSGHWHLIAYCQLREGIRDFRTDRIMKLKSTEETFVPKLVEDYEKLIPDFINGTELEEVKIRFTIETSRYISDQRYYYGFVNEEKIDDYIEMTFMVGNLNHFARWLLMFGRDAEIIEPDSLVQEIQALVRELAESYTTTDIGVSS